MWIPEDSRAISRIDLPRAGTHGWQVRLQRRGVKYGKFFADRRHGGIRGSHDAARVWRDELLRRFDADDAAARVCRLSVRNSSGVVGVAKIRVIAASGTEYWFWQATWSVSPGVRRCVKFSVLRHGEKQAFLLAVEARKAGSGS